MAFDMHQKDNNNWLFELDENTFQLLKPVFEQFYQKTGLQSDYYKDLQLSVGHQNLLLELIDSTKLKDSQVLHFKKALKQSIQNDTEVKFYCD